MNVKGIYCGLWKLYNKNLANLALLSGEMNQKTLKSMQSISGAQLPSSVTMAESLQYYAFRNKLVHDKQAKSIIDKDYL